MQLNATAKSVPSVGHAYAVFNGMGEWCGVVCFGIGATNNIASPYGLKQGQVVELVRVALNGKQESTAKAVSIALRLLKSDAPNVRLVISYADSEQGHFGTIRKKRTICLRVRKVRFHGQLAREGFSQRNFAKHLTGPHRQAAQSQN